MKNYLVTGAAGFIGSNFCQYIMKNSTNDLFVCVDILSYAGNKKNIEELLNKDNFTFIQGDIKDSKLIEELFNEYHFDYVINFAAETHVDRSLINPELFFDTNVNGTRVLLEACRKYGVKRFHQVSTDEVYGDLPLDRPDLFFTEESPLNPKNPYSKSKAIADELVLEYYHKYNVPVTISRSTNNYGPYQFPEKLIPLMISKADKNESLPVYGEGLNVRDWLYVEDHCRGILAVIEKGIVGEVYNLGGHNERNNLYIVKRILSEMGKPESLITHVADRHGHDQRYAIDPHKANVELNWDPVTTFEEGIKKTIEWYLSEYGKKWLEESNKKQKVWLKANYEDRK